MIGKVYILANITEYLSMGTVTTARGRIVDFDLLRIRSEMMGTEPSNVVVERQEAIEDQIRRRREQRRITREKSLAKKQENEASQQVEEIVEPLIEPVETIPRKVRNRINTDTDDEQT